MVLVALAHAEDLLTSRDVTRSPARYSRPGTPLGGGEGRELPLGAPEPLLSVPEPFLIVPGAVCSTCGRTLALNNLPDTHVKPPDVPLPTAEVDREA